MSEENKKTESAFTKYWLFVLAVFCFVGIPASILFYSVYRYLLSEEELLIFQLKGNAQRIVSDLQRSLSAEEYFCRFFHEHLMAEANKPDSNINDTVKLCRQLNEYYKDGFGFLVISKEGEIKYNTAPFQHPESDWLDAYNHVVYLRSIEHDEVDRVENDGINSICKVLGPLAVNDAILAPIEEFRYSFCWFDSSGVIPPSAIYTYSWGGLFVFVSKDLLNDISHLKYIASDYAQQNKVVAGIYDNSDVNNSLWHTPTDINPEEIKSAFENPKLHSSSYIATDNYYVCDRFLSKQVRTFVIAKKNNTLLALYLKAALAFILYCLLSFPIIKYGWHTIVLKQPGNASIRVKLAFLFFFACGIPLLTLGIISREYNLNKRMALIEEARNWSVENLLSIEQRYSSFLKNLCNEYDKYIDDWARPLKVRELTKEHNNILADKFREKGVLGYSFVASEAKYIGAFEGVIRYTGSLDSVTFEPKDCDLNYPLTPRGHDNLKVANIIVKKLCSDLNGTEIPGHILSKLELVAETITQKPFPEIISSVIDTIGIIKEWGFGEQCNMTYFKFISLSEPSKTDYIIVVTWKPVVIQKQFVDSMLYKANRNPKEFRIIAYERYCDKFTPEIYNENTEIKKFARRAGIKPTEELEYINYQGEDYIAVSFLGRQLNQYGFVGLYPVKNVDNVIYKQSFRIWILGLLCLFLAAGLAQIISKSFVKPLFTLEKGAQAIEQRNFKHRLSGLNQDEFGEVGNIFNHVMVGLEELEIAKIVQECMFPKPEFAQGRFNIYGKSVTMIDVGGDYVDFFKIDDNHFAVLLGDVAGHGVGAAVIMAMAKACVLSGGTDLISPAAILNRLHKMVLATKNQKQRKIMTFQYIFMDSDTGKGLYGNAGACTPYLVKHNSGTVEEVKMAGAALGAFKKAVYKEMPFNFEEGDALIFYTDGIVECKNESGEMIGYDGIKQLYLDCWDSNPEKYYQNIYNAYIDYIGKDAEAGDDLTIVILMYNEPKESAYDVTC